MRTSVGRVAGSSGCAQTCARPAWTSRATIQPGDMRHLPFEPGTFDAVVSTYAMDHLRRDDSRLAIEEAARVLKPGGDFLLMVLAKDVWLNFTFGPLLLHGGMRDAAWWQHGAAGGRIRGDRERQPSGHALFPRAQGAMTWYHADGLLTG